MARVMELQYNYVATKISSVNVIVLFPDPQFHLSLWADLFNGYCFCMFMPFAHIMRSTCCAGPVWSMYMAVCDVPARLLHPVWLTCSLLSAMVQRLLLDGIEPWIAVQLCLRTPQTRVWIMLQWKHLWCWCLGAVRPNARVYLHVHSHHLGAVITKVRRLITTLNNAIGVTDDRSTKVGHYVAMLAVVAW